MGTKERKQREFEGREERFLKAARVQIEQDGLLNLQMSRIADKCEYAVGTLYQHFASKEDLLLALTTENARHYADLFQRVAQWKATTRDQMLAIGVADMLFIRKNPHHFRIAQYTFSEAVWNAASEERRTCFFNVNNPVGQVVTGIVNDAIAKGDLAANGLSAAEVATGFWSICLGMQNLSHTQGMLENFEVREPHRLMLRYLHHLLNGFGWKALQDPADHAAQDRLNERICKEVFHDFCTS